MGPYIKETEVCKIEDTVVQCAVPYNKASYDKADTVENVRNSLENVRVNDVPSVSEDPDEEDHLRISTRARYSYELDRYTKNAMLIFEGNSTDIECEDCLEDSGSESDNMSTKFKRTFEKYLFEVEIHRNLSDDEITNTCDRFFQQDFTEYGCVAVLMLAKTRNGIVESSHTPKSEFGVTRYMSDLMPPTLQDKPKIYIVQTEGYYLVPRARVWSTVPVDSLEFRLLVPIVSAPDLRGRRSNVCCLLEQVHEKINSSADHIDLVTILTDATNAFTMQCAQLHTSLIPTLYSTLRKELRFVRTPES